MSTQIDVRTGLGGDVAIKVPCRVATTANITLSGLQTVDGVSVVADDRVLVKDQTDNTENGIYLASTGSWVRAADFNGVRDVVRATVVRVQEGTVFGNRSFELTTTGAVVFGTSAITFSDDPFNEGNWRVDTLATLKAQPSSTLNANDVYYIKGRDAAGDGGEGHFLWDSSDLSSTLNAATVTSTTVTAATDTITKTAHGLVTLMGGYVASAVNGLSANTMYYVIRVDADNFKLATSVANALAGTAVDLTGSTNFSFIRHLDPLEGKYAIASGTLLSGANGAWVRQGDDKQANVLHFGADASGSADSTAAIQSAAYSLGSEGGVVKVPSGTYLVTGTIQINRSYIRIVGDGRYSSRFKTTNATNDVLRYGDGVTNISHCFADNVGFLSSVTRTAGRFMTFDKVQECGISNFYMTTGYTGVELVDSTVCHVDNGYIANPAITTGTGIKINGGNDHYITDTITVGVVGSEPDSAVVIEKSEGTWLDNVGGLQCVSGLKIAPSGTDIVEHIFSERCAWDTNTNHGIIIQPASGATVRRCKFVEDWASTNTLTGVTATGSGTIQDIEFIGLRCYNNQQHGVIFSTGEDISFIGGTFSGNSGASSGTYSGITFSGISNFKVIGATCGAVAGFSSLQGWGIDINNASSDNFIVSDCDLTGNVTKGLRNLAGRGTTKRISNNLGYVSENRGSATIAIGNSSVNVAHGLDFTPSINGDIVANPTMIIGNAGVSYWAVTAADATNITFTVNANVSSTAATFSWAVPS